MFNGKLEEVSCLMVNQRGDIFNGKLEEETCLTVN